MFAFPSAKEPLSFVNLNMTQSFLPILAFVCQHMIQELPGSM